MSLLPCFGWFTGGLTKGVGTQMFNECLLRQWMASGPSCV